MTEQIIAKFQALLEQGQDNALIRFSLGNAYLHSGEYKTAVQHLAQALQHDSNYSAAWKLYAKALAETRHNTEAIKAYQQGIQVAENNGDIQAAKEMKVFLKRLQNTTTP